MNSKYFCLFMTCQVIFGLQIPQQERIVGGEVVLPNSIPYQISLQLTTWDDWAYCGGVLITDNLVVTTAHCCYQVNMDEVKVVAGEHDLYADDETEQFAGVTSAVMHQDYDPVTFHHDICLIKLDTSFELTNGVGVIRTASEGETFVGNGRVSGWGLLSEEGTEPDMLMAVNVTLRSDEECRAVYGALAIQDEMMCAGDNGKDACQGDSGGPLVCGPELRQLCGLVSWGYGCGQDGFYGVYTEISYYKQWLEQATKDLQSL